MAYEWFYARQGNRIGPVSTQQVRALAAAGELGPKDLLWKAGMKAWAPAEKFKGLFAESPERSSSAAPSNGSPPATDAEPKPAVAVVAVDEPPSALEQTQEKINTPPALITASTVVATASIAPVTEPRDETAAKPDVSPVAADRITAPLTVELTVESAQAKRTELMGIILPQAYRRLGQNLQASGALVAEFPDLYRHLNRLTASLASFEATADVQAGDAPDEKKVLFDRHEKLVAQRQSLELRIDQTQQNLGEMAYEKRGDASGPAEIVQTIKEARSQLTALDQQIAAMSSPSRNGRLNMKKLFLSGLFAGVVIAVIAVACFFNK